MVASVCQAKYVVVAYWSSIAAIDRTLPGDVKIPLSLMEYADGGLYQQSALSGALNKPGFPHRGLTCLAITSLAWAIGGVVSVLLIKQLKRLLLVHNTPALWPGAPTQSAHSC
jgi:hypothetical protein